MDHSQYINYNIDDDTVEIGCHYCKWESVGHESEESAEVAWEEHIYDADSWEEEYDNNGGRLRF